MFMVMKNPIVEIGVLLLIVIKDIDVNPIVHVPHHYA